MSHEPDLSNTGHPARQRPFDAEPVVLFDACLELHQALPSLDLGAVRLGFSALFDHAARAVTSAGYDLDDVIVDRALICRLAAGIEFTVEATALSDPARLTGMIRRAGRADAANDIEIVGLQATVWRNRGRD